MAYKKCVSFDGDADRQIYFYGDEDGKLHLIDGDKQFALIMTYILRLLTNLGLKDQLSHILVQTAYCNSRATNYLVHNGINTQLVKTGVKHAHHVTKHFDIGANDEPNGHGTVAYDPEKLEHALSGNNSIDAQKLRTLLSISNRVVGDSIANLLVIESILYDLDMSIVKFDKIYSENPSKLHKIKVDDRTKFKTIDDESRLTHPSELQDLIDACVASVDDGKAFVRPSGTEDILRLYVEAKTDEQVDKLGKEIVDIVST